MISDFGFRIADWRCPGRFRQAVCYALVAAFAVAALAGGCISRKPSLGDAGANTLTAYTQKTSGPGAQTEIAPTDRFAELRKAQPPAPAQPPPSLAKPAASAPATAGTKPEAPAGQAPAGGPPKPPGTRLAGFIDPLTKSGDRTPVTLESCLKRALANNLAVQIARFGPAIAGAGVREAEALFDPSWFLNNALGRIKRQAGSFIVGATLLRALEWDFASGFDSLLPTGGTVSLSQDWTYLRSNSAFIAPNPQYTTGLTLAVRQPLLRGGGIEVTRSPIVLARLDHTISLAEFKARLMNTLLGVEQAYWALVVADTRVQALSEALDAARENQRIAKRRFEEGKDKRLVLSLADAAVAGRQADLVGARLQLAQASDLLKRLIHDRELSLEEPVVLAASELPMAEPIPVSRATLQESMVAALRSRPEMEQAEARVSQAGVRERVARNAQLPQLDLSASYTLSGLDGNLANAMDTQFGTNFRDWGTGLEFRVPIGNRARAAAHERSQLERERTITEREDVRQMILLDVSEAVRDLASAEEAVLATKTARQAAEQSLRDQQANFDAGAALVKDLLDAQRDLADAKVREMDAMVAYMVGLAALERAKGTLLEYNNIRVVDDGAVAPAPAPK